jgi:hypothetical protein
LCACYEEEICLNLLYWKQEPVNFNELAARKKGQCLCPDPTCYKREPVNFNERACSEEETLGSHRKEFEDLPCYKRESENFGKPTCFTMRKRSEVLPLKEIGRAPLRAQHYHAEKYFSRLSSWRYRLSRKVLVFQAPAWSFSWSYIINLVQVAVSFDERTFFPWPCPTSYCWSLQLRNS